MKPLPLAIILSSLFCSATIVGCGSGDPPDEKVEQTRAMEATKVRKIFDAAGGDYTKVGAADKASFEAYAGGAAQAEALWNGMKTGSPISPTSGPNP